LRPWDLSRAICARLARRTLITTPPHRASDVNWARMRLRRARLSAQAALAARPTPIPTQRLTVKFAPSDRTLQQEPHRARLATLVLRTRMQIPRLRAKIAEVAVFRTTTTTAPHVSHVASERQTLTMTAPQSVPSVLQVHSVVWGRLNVKCVLKTVEIMTWMRRHHARSVSLAASRRPPSVSTVPLEEQT
jgi:hypothetical protein